MTQTRNTGILRSNRQHGFTLMELLIVMSIMIILMLIAIPNFISMKAQADETSAIQSLRAIYQAQIQYQTDRTWGQRQRRSAQSAGSTSPAGRSVHGTEIGLHLQHRQLHQGYGQQPGHVYLL
jgi:prepilin-type N-terminal cleavage/methylation domain-containing protein